MVMSNFTGPTGGRSFGVRRRPRVINDINITPLVDVMLVLLIIFMITTPMMVSDIKVDLPKNKAPASTAQDKSVMVSINNKGNVYVNDKNIKLNELVKYVNKYTKGDRAQRIYLHGDRAVNYGKIMAVFAKLNEAGFAKVALVTQTED